VATDRLTRGTHELDLEDPILSHSKRAPRSPDARPWSLASNLHRGNPIWAKEISMLNMVSCDQHRQTGQRP
jgi:hypothetical protein